jgi:hypothetical protein
MALPEVINSLTSTSGTLASSEDTNVTFNSYAGVDMIAQIVTPTDPPIIIGELQTVSYSTHRENVPVRILGNVSPVGFVKGPRTIAGSLIFTVFDSYFFYKLPSYQSALAQGIFPLADMMPPFDIVVSMQNEYGSASKMRIYGVTIVDEGAALSIDDLYIEQTHSFMARGVQPIITQAQDFSRFRGNVSSAQVQLD